MALVPWRRQNTFLGDAFAELDQLHRDVNKLFGSPYPWWREAHSPALTYGSWDPAIDIRDNGNNYEIKAELPGLTKEDVGISIEGDTLTLKGEKKEEKETEKNGYLRSERVFGSFLRQFSFPVKVDAENVKAAYQNGILTVNIPKKEDSKPRQIDVKIS